MARQFYYITIDLTVKGNAQFIFLCNPQKSSANVCLMKILKSTVTKKSNCVFLLVRCKKLLKVAAFLIFSTSIMVLFEIRQMFKDHVLNELLKLNDKETVNRSCF